MARIPAVTKAVIPAAGLGTRFLPATKAIPKEMLPVVDKPAIQYVVEEAVSAGLRDILLVTGRAKGALEDHFDRAPELEQVLKAKGDDERLARIWEPTELATVHYTRQSTPRGLGHAVLCAAHHVGRQPFAVVDDDLFVRQRPDPLALDVVGHRGGHLGHRVRRGDRDEDLHEVGGEDGVERDQFRRAVLGAQFRGHDCPLMIGPTRAWRGPRRAGRRTTRGYR